MPQNELSYPNLRLGSLSRLHGENVRFDGGDKRERWRLETLGTTTQTQRLFARSGIKCGPLRTRPTRGLVTKDAAAPVAVIRQTRGVGLRNGRP